MLFKTAVFAASGRHAPDGIIACPQPTGVIGASKERSLRNLGPSLDFILKLGAFGAAAGYMSLRAHFNTFGIPALAHLGAERYLLEVYVFAIGLLSRAVPLVAGLALVAIAARPLFRRISATRLRPYSDTVVIAVLLVSLVVVALHEPNLDMAVGPLDGSARLGLPAWLFYVLLLSALIGIIYLSAVARASPPDTGNGKQQVRRRAVAVTLGFVCVALPAVFGASVREARYPLVRISPHGAEPVQCGLALYQDDKALFVWRAEAGTGQVRRIELSKLEDVAFGPLRDLRAVVRIAAHSPDAFPSCRDMLPGRGR